MSARPFTGRHAAVVIGGGFLIVIAVNLAMAVLAAGTFTGTVVRNGYVASQDFNRWLAAGRAQQALGWTVAVDAADGRVVLVVTGADGAAVTGLAATGTARHPMDAGRTVALGFREVAPGRHVAAERLPPGAWDLAFALDAGAAGGGNRRFVRTERLVVR
ncbi:MAG: FixH family protein [Thermaurantiacus tibetensis]|uniref:FixH family protein n=1 Tax=Thermaurantiacus tibetensis TaxID=2759035 RepID=UPI00188E5F24|nr:FixH family protein [Thermaurantiacus tibetensis]